MPNLKSLFETPKKAALTVACILVMLVTLGTATVYAASAFAQSSAIGGDAAANFAFADAGVDPASAANLHVEFGRKQGRFVYEVEFTADGAEYEYLIDSEDGSVVKREKEVMMDAPQETPGGMISSRTLEEARAIALADAGVAAGDAVFTEEELDQDNGLWVYEFEFRAGNSKFEYEINANTGAVYSKSVETYVIPSPEPTQPPASTPAPTPESTPQPTPENTPQPAPSQAPAAQPSDNPPPVYTHHPDDHDYDYNYDYDSGHHYDDHHSNRHHTGAVSDQSAPIESNPGMDTGSAYIGTAQAKSIALTHAGLSESQVMVTKAALDRDDGLMVYEVEFRQGQTEYEYKIDAQSGAILEYEIDRD